MRHSLLNGESIEIDYLGQSSEGLEKLYYKFGVKVWDVSGQLVYQNQMTFQERQSERRRGRSVKKSGPEKVVARMMSDLSLENAARDASLLDLLTHLRRQRLAKK